MTASITLQRLLDRLEGTWRTAGRIIDGGDQDGERWVGWDIYEWFPGRMQMVHRVDVEIFGARKEAMEFFTPREGTALEFDQVSFDADGSVERATGSFDEQGRYHNDADGVRAVLTVEGPDAMRALWEMRDADGEWNDWMELTFTRVADPHIEVRSKSDHTV